MPSSDPRQRFQDIIDSIDLIESYLATTTREKFAQGGMAYDATAYCFLKISEAAIKLNDLAPSMAPHIEWEKVRGLGNHLRHGYDGIDPEILWDAAELQLPALAEASRKALEQIERESLQAGRGQRL